MDLRYIFEKFYLTNPKITKILFPLSCTSNSLSDTTIISPSQYYYWRFIQSWNLSRYRLCVTCNYSQVSMGELPDLLGIDFKTEVAGSMILGFRKLAYAL